MPSYRFDGPQRSEPVGELGPVRGGQSTVPLSVEADRPRSASGLPSPGLSVVVPARNEAASLPLLVDEIVQACRALCRSTPADSRRVLAAFEVIIVDDCSTDETAQVLGALERTVPEFRAIRLLTHAGQSGALAAGVWGARGDWIATLDADLQNDPADLAVLWEALADHEVALGWRVQRRDIWSRRLISRVANWVRNAVLGQAIRDTGCSVRIFPRDHALRLPWFRGVHRFLGPLLIRQGCRVVQVPVNHRPRLHGRSHYNLRNRSFAVVVDLLGVAWLMRRPIDPRVGQPSSILEPARPRSHQATLLP